MTEIDEDAHLALWVDEVTCEELNYMYARGGIAYPVSGDFITTGRVETRWSLTDDD